MLACNTTHAYDLYPRSRSGRMTNQASTSDTLALWRQPHPCLLSALPPFPLDLERSRSRLNSESLNALHTHPFCSTPACIASHYSGAPLVRRPGLQVIGLWSQTFLGMMASKHWGGWLAHSQYLRWVQGAGALPSLLCGILNVDGRQI